MKKHVVSFFPTVRSKEPVLVDLIATLLKYHLNSTTQRDLIKRINSETDQDKRSKMKHSLPAFCVGSKMVGGGAAINVTEKLPYLFIDIDTESAIEAQRIKLEAIKEFSAFALFIGLSVSSTGVHIVLLVENANDKLGHWKAIIKQYKEKWPIDESTNDVDTRKAFIGYDPEAFINESDNIVPFTEKETKVIQMQHLLTVSTTSGEEDHKSTMAKLFSKSQAFKEGFAAGKRNAYICSIGYRANRLGIPIDIVIDKLNKELNLSAYPDHMNTLHYIYKNKQSEFGIHKNLVAQNDDDMNWLEETEEYLSRYIFRFNEVTNKVEYMGSNGVFKEMTDYKENSIWIELIRKRIKCSLTNLRVFLESEQTPAFNPFEEYFNNLPEWDGTTDYIQQLADTVKVEERDFWIKAFRKWLVAMVASVLNDDIVNHTVLVLKGAQGAGKSTWLLRLIPEELKKYVYSGTIDPDNKDTLAHITETMLINLDELESLTKGEQSALKELVTKMLIRYRRPYGHNNENFPRRASFAGSINLGEFLTDLTGSRRWLCFETLEVNYEHKIKLDMVYGQALQLFKSGFKFWFDKEEITELNILNDKFRIRSSEEELLLTYFEPDESQRPEETFNASQLANRLGELAGLKVNGGTAGMLGKILRKHNFQRIKKGGLYVYKMKHRKDSPERLALTAMNDKSKPFDEVGEEKVKVISIIPGVAKDKVTGKEPEAGKDEPDKEAGN